jgi:CheY-like chemotaxis protein
LGGRILYVEDDMNNMNLVRKMLRVMGHDLLEAVDGRSGLAVAEREHPDLIFMDVNLPDIAGWEVTERLKRHPVLKEIPIVALTADGSESVQRRCLDAGCDAFMVKPISRTTLLKVIQQFTQPGVEEVQQ